MNLHLSISQSFYFSLAAQFFRRASCDMKQEVSVGGLQSSELPCFVEKYIVFFKEFSLQGERFTCIYSFFSAYVAVSAISPPPPPEHRSGNICTRPSRVINVAGTGDTVALRWMGDMT